MKHQLVYQNKTSAYSGFSLIELMIAVALGLFIIAGIYQIYSSNKDSFRLQKAISQTTRNAQFSMAVISSQINSTGFTGFYSDLSTGVENVLNNPTQQEWDISRPANGFNNVASDRSIAGISGFTAGTDVLLLKEITQHITINSQTSNATIITNESSHFSVGDILLLGDTDQASLFQVSTATTVSPNKTITLQADNTTTPGNSSLLNNAFGATAELGKLAVHMYYIKTGNNNQPALHEAILTNSGTAVSLTESELASNIMDMQLVYGVDENDDKMVDEYVDASAVVTWSRVLSVGIALLASSDNNVETDAVAYEFDADDFNYQQSNNQELTPNKKFRRTFRSFASIRNRAL